MPEKAFPSQTPGGPAWPWSNQAVWRFIGKLRAIRRALLILLWTLALIPAQTICLLLPGAAKRALPLLYWRGVCAALGLRRRVIGTPIGQPEGGRRRAVVFISNHSSWIDIPLLGAELRACFVAKNDVAEWPLISTVARLGRTVFISRRRAHTQRGRSAIAERLAAGDNLILFPEGTTSDGSRVLPFRSAFLGILTGEDPPLVQPVSVVPDRLASLPCFRRERAVFAYYGATSIGTHFWRLAQWPGLRATILLHPVFDPRLVPDRKELALTLWRIVAEGAATLRQNRAPSEGAGGKAALAPASVRAAIGLDEQVEEYREQR